MTASKARASRIVRHRQHSVRVGALVGVRPHPYAAVMLFTPFRLGRLELPNRIVMSPMTRSRAIGNVPNASTATYYALRASAGLIVTEGTAPSPNGLGYPRIPGVYSPEQIAG